jgi:tetratricopeptide (TPR) repeat protein
VKIDMPSTAFVRGFALTALLLCSVLLTRPVLAQENPAPYAEVQRLIAGNELALAEQRLQAWLQSHPQDPQALLLQGVILSQRGDHEAAQRLYESLTQSYPELPEPYNNLAVLHAAAGRLAEARAALESALRFNPGYATAHRNLGDVYAHLALGHWQRALSLQADNAALAARAAALEQLLQRPPAPR